MHFDEVDEFGTRERGGKIHNQPVALSATRTMRRLNAKNARRRITQRRTQQARRVGRRTR